MGKARDFDKPPVVPSGSSVPGLLDSWGMASRETLLGSVAPVTGWVVLDNVGWGASDAPGTVRGIKTLILEILEGKMFDSAATEPDGPTVLDFSGTTARVEESESGRFEPEGSSFGKIELNKLAVSDCPGIMTGIGKTPPPEAVIVAFAVTVPDAVGALVLSGVLTGSDALISIGPDVPSSDCTIFPSRPVFVVAGTEAVIGAVTPGANDPSDSDTPLLDSLTISVSPTIPVPTDALAPMRIGPGSERSVLDP